MVTKVIGLVAGLGGVLLTVVAFGLGFGESAIGLDLVIPGEVGMVVAGAAAHRNGLPWPVILVAGSLGCLAGDCVGYALGRRYGIELVCRWRFTRRRLGKPLARAQGYFDRKGGVAVFVGRWVGALRAVVPVVAGSAKMPFGRFLLWDVPAVLSWTAATILAGYLLGERVAETVESYGRWVSVALGTLIAGVLVWRWRRARRREAQGHDDVRLPCEDAGDEPSEPGDGDAETATRPSPDRKPAATRSS